MRVATIVLFALVLVGSVVIAAQEPQPDVGVPVTDETTKATCSGCHKVDDKGRMTRISYIRTTPEGWQTIIKRMVRNNSLQIDPAKARAIVKYLSNNHGLTPAEARDMMLHAFAGEVLDGLKIAGLRAQIESALFDTLARDLAGQR